MSNLPPSTAPVTTLFNLGIDNALITVPQNYTVPANPPSMPNPPNSATVVTTNTATTTVKDSVTIYVSSILGFENKLKLSFLIKKIDQTIDSALAPIDATTVPADGDPLPILIGDTTGDWVTGTWNADLGGWVGDLPFTLTPYPGYQPSDESALTQYMATSYKTLFINPRGVGGAISPNHPPSYQVNVYAYDSVTSPTQPSPPSYTYAVCNFTLVVSPSVANYGLGVSCVQLTDLTAVNPLPNPVISTYIAAPSAKYPDDNTKGQQYISVQSTTGFHVGDSIIIGVGTLLQDPQPNPSPPPISTGNMVASILSLTRLMLDSVLAFNHTSGETVGNYMQYSYINSVTMSLAKFAALHVAPYVNLYYFFYPLEPTQSNPYPITVLWNFPAGETTMNGTFTGGSGGQPDAVQDTVLDFNNSTVNFNSVPTTLNNYVPGVAWTIPTDYYSRDTQRYETDELYSVWFHLVFTTSPYIPLAGDSYLFQVTGQDTQGVTVTAYTIIRVTA